MRDLCHHLPPCSSHGQPTAKPVPALTLAYLRDKRNKVFPEGQAAPNEPHSYDMMGQAHNVLIEPARRKCRSSILALERNAPGTERRPVLGHRSQRGSLFREAWPLHWPPRARTPALTWKGWYMAGRWQTRSRTALLQSSCRDEAAWPELRSKEIASERAQASPAERPTAAAGLLLSESPVVSESQCCHSDPRGLQRNKGHSPPSMTFH